MQKSFLLVSLIFLISCYPNMAPNAKEARLFFNSSIVEEERLNVAQSELKEVANRLDDHFKVLQQELGACNSFEQSKAVAKKAASALWVQAKEQLHTSHSFDDRSLYWQRLKLLSVVRIHAKKRDLSLQQLKLLQEIIEKGSRGLLDLKFRNNGFKKILLSGFDPFLLDNNIAQSNPSGVTAMSLDGQVIELNGEKAEIQTFLVPVRYSDFDNGLIESILEDFYLANNVDLVTTVSMGRQDFDLERFPGLRRSASAPDNHNAYGNGSLEKPVIPSLNGNQLKGNEFVEFSLPVRSMTKASGKFRVIDNPQVTTLTKSFRPLHIKELTGEIAVKGSGGGYLSNEISYRSIRLRNELGSKIPTGHIHTPRIYEFDKETNRAIVEQITEMLKLSLTEI
ncbi:hypothetical protein [Aliikangiella sp. G2MR2-5]|uniref:hypothetical protein n=1 Tax=Aliikangiella sp. G2MR2-5 TaxID=2788943 RepID=UPI0018A9CB1A|nr:hypothetical protein [Aliikangiella sp. G2MR2-5]